MGEDPGDPAVEKAKTQGADKEGESQGDLDTEPEDSSGAVGVVSAMGPGGEGHDSCSQPLVEGEGQDGDHARVGYGRLGFGTQGFDPELVVEAVNVVEEEREGAGPCKGQDLGADEGAEGAGAQTFFAALHGLEPNLRSEEEAVAAEVEIPDPFVAENVLIAVAPVAIGEKNMQLIHGLVAKPRLRLPAGAQISEEDSVGGAAISFKLGRKSVIQFQADLWPETDAVGADFAPAAGKFDFSPIPNESAQQIEGVLFPTGEAVTKPRAELHQLVVGGDPACLLSKVSKGGFRRQLDS